MKDRVAWVPFLKIANYSGYAFSRTSPGDWAVPNWLPWHPRSIMIVGWMISDFMLICPISVHNIDVHISVSQGLKQNQVAIRRPYRIIVSSLSGSKLALIAPIGIHYIDLPALATT
jgi:hypothetical protein